MIAHVWTFEEWAEDTFGSWERPMFGPARWYDERKRLYLAGRMGYTTLIHRYVFAEGEEPCIMPGSREYRMRGIYNVQYYYFKEVLERYIQRRRLTILSSKEFLRFEDTPVVNKQRRQCVRPFGIALDHMRQEMVRPWANDYYGRVWVDGTPCITRSKEQYETLVKLDSLRKKIDEVVG